MGRTLCALVVLSVVLGGVGAANADLILTKTVPDITVTSCSFDYNSATGVVQIIGYPSAIDYNGTPPPDKSIDTDTSDFSLSFKVNSAGQITGGITGPDMSLSGVIQGNTTMDTLTGDISQFGFPTSGGTVFYFLLNNLGGTLASQFSPQVGLTLGASTWLPSKPYVDFAHSFTNDGEGNIDAFPVPTPEPATSALLLAGLAASGAWKLRRHRRRTA